MAFDPRDFFRPKPEAEPAPLAGTRAERMQRLQIGGFGVLAMVLLVGLADAITSRVQLTEEGVVPDAAPTVVASETAAPRDPLADAGVVPDLPADPTPTPTPTASPAPEPSDDQTRPASNVPLQ
ncbi:hypothetical protein [Aurantiacibacter gilvus]|uniref:Energy transducer TonB n=1 Tax=Aurantiacibacter gilvus TaxID=3139141 RepID=A0ABU9IBR1_9SPHN